MINYCPNCEREREFRIEERVEDHTIRGVRFTPTISAEVCCECGQVRYDHEREQELIEKLYAEYRRGAGLLFPEEIRATRERYGLSQRSFGCLLGAGEVTINRYENGALQDAIHDSAIRFLETPANMITLLNRRGHLLPTAQTNRALATAFESDKLRSAPDPFQAVTGICSECGKTTKTPAALDEIQKI